MLSKRLAHYILLTHVYLLLLWVLSVDCSKAQSFGETIKISGIVTDTANLPLKGATIAEATSKTGALTDEKGFYQLSVSRGTHTIVCSFVGYKSITKTVDVQSAQTIDFSLASESVRMKEVIVSSRAADKQVQSIQTGVVGLSRKEISSLPLFFGEPDFYKAIQLMPGVQLSGEGNAGIYVRGGGYDQNLILLDQAVVYNPTHLLGFYSVFNTDIINDVTMIKSGMPAEYGNRISSVIEFTSKRTIPERVKTTGNIGLLSSRVNVDVPLFNQHGALYLAARKTYVNSLLDIFRKTKLIKPKSILYKTGYDFYDLNASLVLAPNKKDRIFLSTYKGDDWFVLNSNVIDLHADMSWGNKIASLSWNHLFTPDFYIDNYVTYSGYGLDMNLRQNQYNFDLRSGIDDYAYKNRITWNVKKHKLRTGMAIIRHNVVPNSSSATSDSLTLHLGSTNHYKSYELSFFLSDEIAVTERLGIAAGLRFNTYYHVGEYTDYQPNGMGGTDTIHYRKGQMIKNYNAPEVRLSVRYLLSSDMSVKLSFSTNNQYVHLVNASSITFPTDFWIPSSKLVKPQTGNQWVAGLYKNFLHLETSVEVYYKTFQNQTEFYKGIFNSINNSSLDQNLIFGKGRAYGVELLLRKNEGKLTGWIGYTFSRSEKSFADIENGRWFPAKYDRPHDVSVVANYAYNQRWKFSMVFVFATGNSYTPVVARYFVAGNVVNQYGRYNAARMPSYHRLDLSATCLLKKTDKFSSSLNFSVLNVYNRQNPFFIFPEVSGDINKSTMKVNAKEVSIFPILPSVSWQFSF